jgi:hypothetical protein
MLLRHILELAIEHINAEGASRDAEMVSQTSRPTRVY